MKILFNRPYIYYINHTVNTFYKQSFMYMYETTNIIFCIDIERRKKKKGEESWVSGGYIAMSLVKKCQIKKRKCLFVK